jgi:hypothetical protein
MSGDVNDRAKIFMAVKAMTQLYKRQIEKLRGSREYSKWYVLQ